MPYMSPGVIFDLLRNHSIIAFCLFAFSLFAFNNSDQSAPYDAAGECWFIHENQHVHRIAILAYCGRHESKVVGKRHTRGKDFL